MEPEKDADKTDELSLWQAWLSEKSSDARSHLFFFYGQWLRMITRLLYVRYPHPLAEWHDYVNLASIGLLQAIDRFNPALNTRFQAYAEPYVKGNVLKGLACYVRDSRKMYQDRLVSLSGSEDEGASDLEHVANVAIGLAFGLFLESGIIDHEPEASNPLNVYEVEQNHDHLNECVKQLPPNEQRLIVAHYYQHLSFTEISELMGLSKGRISQLHAQALKRVRQSHEHFMGGVRW
ncbi:sigma-70 family RNA polymerase sigma factor [Pseudomonas marginalis]|jgi:RNA polymerase sigma factor for flagellar operon FliA|uniref:sigma-70 family RNA polymerase sigma factor n=1 Tax=Pseudomonas marginalis TaxID=298 RepID=UPI0024814DA0|nr:sigma-70 family RNA polymerase sigma factor [Pseudomonas marginalis]WGT26703.1 sigma-70 family RNA polymerase sigma factor [Pseudomonas marginalis]